MADKGNHYRDVSQYKYSAMSNLVLQADRRFVTRRGNDEASGDPESLAGRLSMEDLGSRVARASAPKARKTNVLPEVERGKMRDGQDVLAREKRRAQGEARGGVTLAGGDGWIEGLRYRPRSQATRDMLDLILTEVATYLDDVPHEVVRSAADAVLEYLKDEDLKDVDKKREIDDLLGVTMDAKQFNKFVNLGKKITDYDKQEDDEEMQDDKDGDEMDDRQGVAVHFENGKEEDGMMDEVGDESLDEDENGEEPTDAGGTKDAAEGEGGAASMVDGDTMVFASGAAKTRSGDKDYVAGREIDAYWLQRQIGRIYPDAHVQHEKTQAALHLLAGEAQEGGGEKRQLREMENDIMELFDYEHHELVAKLIENRDKVVWLTRRARAGDARAREVVEREMAASGLQWILDELDGPATGEPKKATMKMQADVDAAACGGSVDKKEECAREARVGGLAPRKLIKLENMVFGQGNHVMTNAKVQLPEGTVKRTFHGYEEIHVPAAAKRHAASEAKVAVGDMPTWAQKPFQSMTTLNSIQSRCYAAAFGDDGNMLVCAPTGSGKTNVAMLAIVREIGKHMGEQQHIELDAFKMVYMAPLKALVQEQVGNFGKRLGEYGIKVAELTGDRQLTKQQIAETQLIVTTPEKWDVITRKASDMSYTNLVRLMVIDEIHLLHDERGPVLESIVSRTMRRTEQTGESVRIVGLSATLPNYRDVASFLRVDARNGLFHFDGAYRPCPLRQEFIGVTERKALHQLRTMNDITYRKVVEHAGQKRHQMLVFVHSRKDTAKTAKYIRDKALELETMGQVLPHDAGVREVLHTSAGHVTNADLKELMPYGLGIHHAGMSRADRNEVEDLFAAGSLRVLVSTATLAWGVNLPAHTVLIKGTKVYAAEKGSWVELSPQDVLQMLGRAGRPQYDTYGEGIVMTTQAEMPYYLSLLNQQLPIESQLASRLVDTLNAEIVLGNVASRDEGVEWLGYTYLFVRMMRAPGLYGVGDDDGDDGALEQTRVDLVHSAAMVLRAAKLAQYDDQTGRLQATELGRIASHYYITHASMSRYERLLQAWMSEAELLRVFAQSAEFGHMTVRSEERLELAKLLGRVPIPVKETVEEPAAKTNVLLQAYISRLRLDGLALLADMVHVTQSAGRLLRALFEIARCKGWASVARLALGLCKTVEKRMWPAMSPLRQFAACPGEIVRKAERIDVPLERYLDLDPHRMGELLGLPRAGKLVCSLVARFPRLDMQAQVQPLTRSRLRIELVVTPRFVWDADVHGAAEVFWVVVEDGDGDSLLYHDQLVLRRDSGEHVVELTVAVPEPLPPHYFISLVSDRWLHAETRMALSFAKLVLPAKSPPPTKLLDLQPLTAAALQAPDLAALFARHPPFGGMQAQTFHSLFKSDNNVLVAAPPGCGKTRCAEFALLRLWSKPTPGRAVYLAPSQALVDRRFRDWHHRFADLRGGRRLERLTGDTLRDLELLERAHLVLATPAQWDGVSRQWRRRRIVQTVVLVVADALHMLGYVYETVVARMHYMRTELALPLRIVALSASLAHAGDVADWIDAKRRDTYNFAPHVRPVPLELHLQTFAIPHLPSLMLAMAKPAYRAVTLSSACQPAMVFVHSRHQARATARDLLAACVADGAPGRFLGALVQPTQTLLSRVREAALADALAHGIGYYHEALGPGDRRIVLHLYTTGAVQLLVASRDACWELDCTAHLVIVMGTQYYDGHERRLVDYGLAELLHMFGKALQPGPDGRGRGLLLLPAVKRHYYKTFLNEPLPLESHLHSALHDALVPEISCRLIDSAEDALNWLTFSYFYRRLLANPSYYGLALPTQDGLSNYLSDLVESTLKDLGEAGLVDFDADDGSVAPQNAAMIAAYYNISYVTMQTLLLSLTPRTKLKGILEIVASAAEFDALPIRRHEDPVLRRIYSMVPLKMAAPDYQSTHFKAFVLLQAHFSRLHLPVDLAKDQELVLSQLLRLLSATVDVLSSDLHLNATHAMEMSQMVVQAMWDRDSPLKQIPHFSADLIERAHQHGIRDVLDFMDQMQDPALSATLVKALGLSQQQLQQAADFTNTYPDLSMTFEVQDADHIRPAEPAYLHIAIERDLDEQDDQPLHRPVHAPYYPAHKTENWWLVVAEESTSSLLAIKRLTIASKLDLKLEFSVPTPGKHQLKLLLMSDSYVGVDQDPAFEVTAREAAMDDVHDDHEKAADLLAE